MTFDIEGHKFIVTGAARGIGLAISKRLAELGADVSGWDLETDTMASDRAFTHTAQVDVTDDAAARSAAEASIRALGGLHGMIASAGINGPTKPAWEYTLAEWEQVMKVDLTGVFLSTTAVLSHLIQEGYGRLVIVSSVAGKEGNPGAAAYGAAKAGVIGFAKGLARELLPSNITVNCLAPAITETDLMKQMTPEYIRDKKSLIPMGRFCTTAEIADMAAWVASPRCSFTTGQVFDLTGGRATY
ncbi:MAG: 3-oxoacyl-ACP reductase [Chloroflexi bacterium]|jgi:3-oxoacyl-[acyl-carrier protein] reductase|nr:3-oxoacyl-ACP reductase [Chloroflexota bacterium]MDP6420513.1 SDR family NAD(P)-dependent oxidoreductase [SAR202 cluster bacterium]MDP6799178.1 SDR family NAD(P)-dependent oxidoreductase [SAR202 cluster bacterium]MQG56459.1 SDR family oxidoreductase [SAR202 cluster bacterium]HAL48579.1 3-oxoacyl-ACP reductase [Dehalococcoidia bacterium]|tara:strand:- start:13310 stop:14041 length:732 start_codon:yes stop_codon:yes gene_type:complete